MLNNINISGLSEMTKEATDNPKEGIASYGVKLDWVSGSRMHVETLSMHLGEHKLIRPYTFEIDEPSQLGGINKAPNPQEYLLAGIASCIAVTFITGATANKIAIEILEIIIKGHLDLAGFLGISENHHAGFHELNMELRVKGDGTDADYKELMDRVKKHSPNFNNMENEVKIIPSLVLL